MNLIERTLNLFFPPICGMCNKLSDGYLCDYCYEYLKTQEYNIIDKYVDRNFSEHFWMYKYKDEIRERIIDYKFNDKSYLYRTFLELILKNDEAIKYIKSYDVIVPVPIHKKRYKKRGYNQSELITRALHKKIDSMDYADDIIKKVVNIRPQSTLNKSERLKNISGAYSVENSSVEYLQGKRILLVDDVFTTGSTIDECAKTIKSVVNADVGAFTIAKD